MQLPGNPFTYVVLSTYRGRDIRDVLEYCHTASSRPGSCNLDW